MKTKLNKKKLALLTAVSSLAFLTGCGQSPTNNGAVGVIPGAIAPGYGVGGCVPINTTNQIPFTATNMYFGNGKMIAGQLQNGQAIGQVLVGGAAALGAGTLFRGQRVDGTSIQVSVTASGGYMTQPGIMQPLNVAQQGNASGSGVIQLNSLHQQLLIQQAAKISSGGINTTYPMVSPGIMQPGMYPTTYPQQGMVGQACVSGLAIQLNVYEDRQWLYMGNLTFYLNGTQHGYTFPF